MAGARTGLVFGQWVTDLINRTGIDLCADAVDRVTCQYLSSQYDGDGFRALYTTRPELGQGRTRSLPVLARSMEIQWMRRFSCCYWSIFATLPEYNSIRHTCRQKKFPYNIAAWWPEKLSGRRMNEWLLNNNSSNNGSFHSCPHETYLN